MSFFSKQFSWQLLSGVSLAIFGLTLPTQAQVISDHSLGTIVGCTGATCTISGGRTDATGRNLFHSFQDFSIPTGTAIFASPVSIQNIISRVTGSNPSNINGTIRSNSTANIFLINPNGIVLGRNARLLIGGSFVATTANLLQFGDQGSFGPSTGNDVSLLTINPSALIFNQLAPKPITSQANLSVSSGRSLLLVGGNVDLTGGQLTVPGGRVELGGVSGVGQANLTVNGNALSMTFPQTTPFANISIKGTQINTRARGGGDINIYAHDFLLSAGGTLRAGISGRGTDASQSGNIEVKATGVTTLTGAGTFISNAVLENSIGRGGDVNLTTDSLIMSEGAQIYTGARSALGGASNAGNINIYVNKMASLSGVGNNISTGVYSQVEEGAVGQGGNINLTAESLSLTSGAVLETDTDGKGNAGSVNIKVRNNTYLDGIGTNRAASGLYSLVSEPAVGHSGGINLETKSLLVKNGAIFQSNTYGIGNAGAINITVQDTAQLDGVRPDLASLSNASFQADLVYTGIYNRVETTGQGQVGGIYLNAQSVLVTNGALVTGSTGGQGDASIIEIQADQVTLDGVGNFNTLLGFSLSSGIFSAVKPLGIGNGGRINVTTKEFTVSRGAIVIASVTGQGPGGNININADSVNLYGVGDNGQASGLFTPTEPTGRGDGGTITVNSRNFRVADGAVVSSRALSSNNGGSILINAESFEAVYGGQLITSTYRGGHAGNIILNVSGTATIGGVNPQFAEQLQRFGRSRGGNDLAEYANSGLYANTQPALGTQPASSGDGGNILVNASTLQLLDQGAIDTRTQGGGAGGNITINANTVNASDGGRITTATSGTGQAGDILLTVNDLAQFTNAGTGLFANTESGASGDGGNITVYVPVLQLADQGAIDTRTQGGGTGGNITINANTVNASGGGRVTTATSETGQAGDILLTVNDLAQFTNAGTGLFANTEPGASGDGGNITVYAPTLQLTDRGAIDTRTQGGGAGGNITINANTVNASGGGQITTATSATGRAGDIFLQVKDLVRFSDPETGLFASTASNSTGDGGNIAIAANELILTHEARVAVNSQGDGIAGNIQIDTGTLRLSRGAEISAETTNQDGGNIDVQVADLLWLRYGSRISTTAGTAGAGGNGGNIRVSAPYIFAFPNENSDITANAFAGNGGRVEVQAQRLFGIDFRDRLTPLSDITASSELGNPGVVNIDTLAIDPSQSLAELPGTLVDPNALIAQNACERGIGSEFVTTGRGGLSPDPAEAISPEVMQVGLVEPRSAPNRVRSLSVNQGEQVKSDRPSSEIAELAQGWIQHPDGTVTLVADHPMQVLQPQLVGQNQAVCSRLSSR